MSPTGRASPTRRDPACYLKSILKNVFVYMRGGLALLVGLRKKVLSESKTQLLNFLSMQICSSRIIFNGLLLSIRKFAIFDLKGLFSQTSPTRRASPPCRAHVSSPLNGSQVEYSC